MFGVHTPSSSQLSSVFRYALCLSVYPFLLLTPLFSRVILSTQDTNIHSLVSINSSPQNFHYIRQLFTSKFTTDKLSSREHNHSFSTFFTNASLTDDVISFLEQPFHLAFLIHTTSLFERPDHQVRKWVPTIQMNAV